VAQTLTVVEALDESGRADGAGTAAALLDVDLPSFLAFLDFPAVVFFAADFALLALAVAVDELLAPLP
jgi:hypothetical protein